MDIGANLGLFTIILSDLIGGKGKVYSFEPCAIMFNKLNANIKLNKLNNVNVFKLGIGEKENKMKMFFNPQQSGLSSLVEKVSEDCLSEIIDVTTLDRFTIDFREKISFIKIDTEGFEPQVLKGGIKLLQRDKPVIFIELGGKYQSPSIEALEILKKLNYNCEAYSIDLSMIPPGTNFIALPEGNVA
jgi:FkbM family methyltransferase